MSTDKIYLPYAFDNIKQARTVLVGLWASIPVMLGMSIFLSTMPDMGDETLKMLQVFIPLLAMLNLPASIFIYRLARPAKGSVSNSMVIVEGDKFCGLTSPAVSGTFSLSDYKGLRILQHKQNAVLKLVGPTPDRTIALRGGHASVIKPLASQLSELLNLPLLDQ